MTQIGSNLTRCQRCGALNVPQAVQCSACGESLVGTQVITNLQTAALTIFDQAGEAKTVNIRKITVTLGTDKTADVALPTGRGIAARHAQLHLKGARYELVSLADGYRVFVNDVPLTSPHMLRDGDRIRLTDQNGTGITLTYSNPIERALTPAQTKGEIALTAFPFTIGRDSRSHFVINSLAASWNHAQIIEQGGQHVLIDLDSRNGTYVNDKLITKPHRLREDDGIRIDQVLLVYKSGRLRQLPVVRKLQLDAHEIAKTHRIGLRRELNTMRGVSVSILPGEFVAIIGGSGSGKSTLMRALNGVSAPSEGTVTINGDALYSKLESYQRAFGYVPQADIVHEELSVWEALTFSARLRFPNESAEARIQRIHYVLDDLELTDFAQQLIRNLSGGQRKRVSIALELMAEPHILMMDEPSSGLDPGLDRSMMLLLRRIADRGEIVVIVTHTTLNIELCNLLVVMARGSLAYFGPPSGALQFFGVSDYSDLYNRVQEAPPLTATAGPTEAARAWSKLYQGSRFFHDYIKQRRQPLAQPKEAEDYYSRQEMRRRRANSFWYQTLVLVERNFALVRRDARTLALMLVVLPLIGLFLVGISLQLTPSSPPEQVPTLMRSTMLIVGDRELSETDLQRLDFAPLSCASEAPIPPALTTCPPVDPPQNNPLFTNHAIAIATHTPAADGQRVLFTLALASTLLGIFSTAYTIVAERSLFLREKMVNLRVSAYLAAKMIVYAALTVISSIVLLLIVSLGIELPARGVLTAAPIEMLITLILTAFTGITMGLLLSALNRRLNAVTYLMLGVLFVQILFAGVLFDMNGALSIASRLTTTRWSLEALGATTNLSEQDEAGRIYLRTLIVNNRTAPPILMPNQGSREFIAPSTLGFDYPPQTDPAGLLTAWAALSGFSLLFVLGSYIALRRNESF